MIQLSCNFKTNFQTLHHILSIDLVMSYCINRFIPFSFFFNILHSFCMVIVFFMQILHLILLIFYVLFLKFFLMTLQTMFINVICWLFCTFVFNTSVQKRHLVSCFLHAPLVDTTYILYIGWSEKHFLQFLKTSTFLPIIFLWVQFGRAHSKVFTFKNSQGP